MPKVKIVIAGGGTGGHIYPGIAIAQALQKYADCEITFVGTRHRLESKIVPKQGYRLKTILVTHLTRKFHWRTFLFIPFLLIGLVQSLIFLSRYKPQVVVGTGGFVSGPVVFAAWMLGIPTLIQEQNSLPGITTKLLSKIATEIHLSFHQSKKYFKREGVFLTGNPVRQAPPNLTKERARETFGLDPSTLTILVFGGSQGAHAINQAVVDSLEEIVGHGQMIWQTGQTDFEWINQKTALFSPRIKVQNFIFNMEDAYTAADLVICRAGATTIAELTIYGCPAILIPFPYAAENHQEVNALSLVEENAAVMIHQSELTGGRLKDEIQELLSNPERFSNLTSAIRRLGRPNAADEIAKRILFWIE